MQAWAAEAGAAHDAAFYADPTFWVFIGFVIFVAAAGRTIFRVATIALDDRAETIRRQLDEAEKLRLEAKEMLSSYRRKQREAAAEAESIIEHAKEEAARIRANAAKDIEETLKRREVQARERIAQVEAKAVAEVRNMAAELALAAAHRLIEDNVKETESNKLIEDAIAELPDKLH